jgi:hypothetical protein
MQMQTKTIPMANDNIHLLCGIGVKSLPCFFSLFNGLGATMVSVLPLYTLNTHTHMEESFSCDNEN